MTCANCGADDTFPCGCEEMDFSQYEAILHIAGKYPKIEVMTVGAFTDYPWSLS